MADKKISELSNVTLSALTLSEVSVPTLDENYASGKITETDRGNFINGAIPEGLEYASLQTTSKKIIGAINEIYSSGADLDLIIPEYDSTQTYGAGDYVIYNDALYRCKYSTTGAFDPTKWDAIASVGAELKSVRNTANQAWDLSQFNRSNIIGSEIYSNAKTYAVGDLCFYGNPQVIYRCKTAITTPHNWNSSEWEQICILADLNLKADKTAVEQAIDALLPIDTASGSIANFNTSVAKNLVSVVAQITAVQSGSGDPAPDNVRTISGFTGANIYHTGVNICEGLEQGTIELYGARAGLDSPSTIRVRTKYIPVKPNETYITSTNGWVIKNGCSYDKDKNFKANSIYPDVSTGIITIPDNVYFVRFIYAHSDPSETCEPDDFWYQFEYGSIATNYQAYNPNSETISVDWEDDVGTVYGGSLDVKTGVLTVDKLSVDLGSLEWTYHAASGSYLDFFDTYLPNDSIIGTASIAFDGKCEIYSIIPSNQIALSGYDNNVCALAANTRRFIVCDQRFTNASDLTNALDGVKLIYPLATPTTYQLTPQEIETLIGVNNIWADTGDIAVQFKCTPQDYIDSKL